MFGMSYLTMGLGVVILLLGAALGVQTWRVHDLKAANTVLVGEKKALVHDKETLEGNVTAMETSRDAEHSARVEVKNLLDTCSKAQAILTDAAVKSERAKQAAEVARGKALAELSKLRGVTYATDPACRSWGAAPVCGAVSQQLFNDWNDGAEASGNGSGNSQGRGEQIRRDPAIAYGAPDIAGFAETRGAEWSGRLQTAVGMLQ